MAATQPTKVKGVTLGKTGSADRGWVAFGVMLILVGSALTASTLRRRTSQH